MEKILRVDMQNLQVTAADVPEAYRFLGGRALTSRIVLDEVVPACDPLGDENKLVLAPGLLAGTTISSCHRISIGAKSPLTGTIKESNGGGNVAKKMARLGIKALIIQGKPADGELYLLYIQKGGVKVLPAGEYRNMGTYRLNEKLRQRFGDKVAISCIGPSGEMGLRVAGIANSDREGIPSRYSGRGGLGAVMGMRGLKAIIFDDAGSDGVEYADKENYRAVARELNRLALENEGTKTFTTFGTAAMLDLVNTIGGLPTRNFSAGAFEGAEKINGHALHDTIVARGGSGDPSHACMDGCLVRCSNVYPDEQGKTIVSPLEYETIGLMGSNLGIDNLDTIARLNWICNDLGLDTIESGAALGVVMEAGIIPFGDGEGAVRLLQEVEQGTVLGRLIGNGALIAGQVLGISRVPAVKGQSMPAYDPRAIKGNGVTYATSPMGADHTAGNMVRSKDPSNPQGQATASANSQKMMAAYDSLGLCMMMVGATIKYRNEMQQLINAKVGEAVDLFSRLGEEALNAERRFNRLAGFTAVDDRLPEFMRKEKLPPRGMVFDIPDAEIDSLTDL